MSAHRLRELPVAARGAVRLRLPTRRGPGPDPARAGAVPCAVRLVELRPVRWRLSARAGLGLGLAALLTASPPARAQGVWFDPDLPVEAACACAAPEGCTEARAARPGVRAGSGTAVRHPAPHS